MQEDSKTLPFPYFRLEKELWLHVMDLDNKYMWKKLLIRATTRSLKISDQGS